jgi:quinol monooxygenase YgiN
MIGRVTREADMIGIVAILKVKDGSQEALEAVFRDLAPQVRAHEPGNKLYSLTRKQGSTTEYVVMEQYDSMADVAAHGKAPHFLAAQPKLGALLDGRPEIIMLDGVV